MTKSTTSRFHLGILALAAALLLVAPWGPVAGTLGPVASGSPSAQEVHRLDGPRVAVYNLAGAVEVVRGDGSQVEIEVTRGGADRDRLSVEIGRIGDRETLRVIYPGDRVVYRERGRSSSTTVRVGRDGTFLDGRRGGDRVRISGTGGGLEAHANLSVRVPSGVEVAVYLAVGEGRARDLGAGLTFRTGSGRVDVANVTGPVDVDTGSGAVRISEVRGHVDTETGSGEIALRRISGGEVTAETGSGRIALEEISGSSLRVDTGSGRISGRALAVEELSLDTGSGRIEVDGLEAARISCDTGSGSVHLGLTADIERLVVDTGSGGVTVEVPSDFGATMELSSGSGSVSVDVPGRDAAVAERRYFRGSVGDGEGRVMIETGSGGITVRGS